MNKIKIANRLELHYFLRDSSHRIDAFARNYCEKEILLLFREISEVLNVEVAIEAEALQEGGLRELWKAIGKNSAQITFILALLTVIISRIPVESKLQKENLRLDNELKTLEIEQIKNKLRNEKEIGQEVVNEVYNLISKDYKILWHKSNFYKKLNMQLKVDKISTTLLDENNRPADEERIVLRKDFFRGILTSDKLPHVEDEEAIIDIIAPVIKKGKYTWKGYYKGEPISFEMGDSQFKESIINKEIKFENGTAIKCVLRQSRRIDENGMIKVSKSRVLIVLEIIENYKAIQTNQGKRHKQERKKADNQLRLFD